MARSEKQIISDFGRALDGAQIARMRMGELFLELVEVKGTQAAAAEALNNAYPNAKDRLGYALTVSRLRTYADLHRSLQTNGGIKRGKHVITGVDLENLGLTPDQALTLVNKIETDQVRIKDVKKQVTKANAGVVEEDASKVEDARNVVLQLITETEAPKTLEEQIAELVTKRERALKTAEKANAEAARLAREIAELQAGSVETDDDVIVPPTGEHVQAAAAA